MISKTIGVHAGSDLRKKKNRYHTPTTARGQLVRETYGGSGKRQSVVGIPMLRISLLSSCLLAAIHSAMRQRRTGATVKLDGKRIYVNPVPDEGQKTDQTQLEKCEKAITNLQIQDE